MDEYGIEYKSIILCCYVKGMFCYVKIYELDVLVDKLIIGVYIEVCFCECFVKLVLYVDKCLGDFYILLLCFEVCYY